MWKDSSKSLFENQWKLQILEHVLLFRLQKDLHSATEGKTNQGVEMIPDWAIPMIGFVIGYYLGKDSQKNDLESKLPNPIKKLINIKLLKVTGNKRK